MKNLFDGEYSALNSHAHYWMAAGKPASATLTFQFATRTALSQIKLAAKSRSGIVTDFSVSTFDDARSYNFDVTGGRVRCTIYPIFIFSQDSL
jgi:hypothetical protein